MIKRTMIGEKWEDENEEGDKGDEDCDEDG